MVVVQPCLNTGNSPYEILVTAIRRRSVAARGLAALPEGTFGSESPELGTLQGNELKAGLALALGVARLLVPSAEAANYIAPPPPDAVVLRGRSEHGTHNDIFLSKQTPEEVRAFYAARLGSLQSTTGSATEADSPVVLKYQQVLDILMSRHRDLTLADDLRVNIKWKADSSGQSSCVGDFFRELFLISQIQKRQTEFDALCKQYGYLQNGYFQRVPDPHRPGQWIDADKEILARAHETHGGQQAQALSQSSAQTAQRLQQLAMSGHSAEASALAAQFTQQAMQTSNSVADWNGWLSVLRQGDAVGYRTLVILPTHPSTW